MTKHCIICNELASLRIKDTPDYYCQGCAEENFADLTVLVRVEDEAQRLKEYVKEKTESDEEEPEHVSND